MIMWGDFNSSMTSIRWGFSDDDYKDSDMPIYLSDVSSCLIGSITKREALRTEINRTYGESLQLNEKKRKNWQDEENDWTKVTCRGKKLGVIFSRFSNCINNDPANKCYSSTPYTIGPNQHNILWWLYHEKCIWLVWKLGWGANVGGVNSLSKISDCWLSLLYETDAGTLQYATWRFLQQQFTALRYGFGSYM